MTEDQDQANRTERDRVIAAQVNYLFIPDDCKDAIRIPFHEVAVLHGSYVIQNCRNRLDISWPQFNLKAVAYKDSKRRGFHLVKEEL